MPEIAPLRQKVQAKIRKYELLASSGLWALAAFTALSIGAARDFDFLPSLSDGFRSVLGAAPPTSYINWALVLYGFAAIIKILTQMGGTRRPGVAFVHVLYLAAFYMFYHFTGDLRENLWAIFAVGMTILALQGYHIWTYYKDRVREEQEILAELNKLLDEEA